MTEQMPREKLLIDVDGVLRDFIGGLIAVYRREYPDHEVAAVNSRRLEDFFPLGEGIYEFMDQHYAEEILLTGAPFRGAIEALAEWEQQFEIVIATNQPPAGRFPTLQWLGRHRVPCSSVHMIRDKFRLPGYALLDDFVDNLEAFEATGRLAVCLDQPWNQHWSGPRVASVNEFFAFVVHCMQRDADSMGSRYV